MRLFGELGCCEYEVKRICGGIKLKANGSIYEFTLIGEHEKQSYLHVDQAQLEQLMSDAGVHTPMELVGCEIVKQSSFNSATKIAILPKGAHVELIALDEDGKELEVQFRQY